MYNKSRKPANNVVVLSKQLSWILRHGALKEGLSIQGNGFVKVEELLKHPNYCRVFTIDILQQIVNTDAKQRYTMRRNPEGGFFEIRANQGHSMEVVVAEECLSVISNTEEVPMAVHGTYYRHWDSIKAGGLKRLSRNHVHFAITDATRSSDISGFRGDCQLLIYLDVEKVLKDGALQLYRSDNNVILCSGLKDGSIPCKYFLKVVDRKTGQLLDV